MRGYVARKGNRWYAVVIDTYQHILPGMEAEAARTYEQLIKVARPKTAGRRTA